MKNKIILVGGYCAAGKSTFSRELARLLSVPCFNKDTIKEVIGEGFGPNNTDVRQKNSSVTFMLMLYIAECFLRAGTPCILESNFRTAESGHIRELLDRYDGECLTFIFKGNLDVLYKRYVERERAGDRHWVHLAVDEEARESFKSGHICGGLGKVSVGRTIHVDTTDFGKVDYDGLYLAAREFMEL
ncbi:MAG: ATP-binding protein [Oscillospiraceae bacterium]|nr:ATP-binding protein [Oscillospiraceae bacterium]